MSTQVTHTHTRKITGHGKNTEIDPDKMSGTSNDILANLRFKSVISIVASDVEVK